MLKSTLLDNMAKKDKKKPVSAEQFDALAGLVKSLAGTVQALVDKPTSPEAVVAKNEVDDAGPDDQPMNPHWRKIVNQVLGEDFDCECAYPKSGGVLFKVIVPKNVSNAPQSYWEMYKRDVRTKEIGHTGAEGVKKWCELIKKNLARTKREQIN